MHPLQKQFHDVINKKLLFQKNEKVLLAVSGGVDSMVLAHLFLASEYSFGIAHCNFGLRGSESDDDEKLVHEWSKKNGIVFHVKHFELGEGSIQLAARNARYAWFEELCKEFKYDNIVTAHHLNDSLETTLLNLSRGTGIKGISGIQSISGKVIRPLLFATKESLIQYATDQKMEWREDASNSKTDYSRNLVRHKIVPILEELNPSLHTTFANTAERLQLTNQLLEEIVEKTKSNHLNQENDFCKLETGWITKETDMIILSEILSTFGFNYVTSKEIYAALGKSGKLFLSESYELTIDRQSLFIKVIESNQIKEILIHEIGEYSFDNQRLMLSEISVSNVDFNDHENVAYLDASMIQFPLKIRTWKMGDRFKPLGMSGWKKVSDYLIDKKVPMTFKPNVKVLTSGKEIVWLIGYRISDDCKLNKQTQSVLRLEIT